MSTESTGTPGYRVTRMIEGANTRHLGYPLLTGDILVAEADGSYTKECPGIAVGGFRLTPEQQADLVPVTFVCHGLDYTVTEATR